MDIVNKTEEIVPNNELHTDAIFHIASLVYLSYLTVFLSSHIIVVWLVLSVLVINALVIDLLLSV